MTRTKGLLAAVIAVVVVGALAAGGVSAAGGKKHRNASLVGTWIVTIERGPLGPLTSLVTYTDGHGLIETSNSGATVRTASQGVWHRVGPSRFEATSMLFRFDPAAGGAFVGTAKLRMAIELDAGGNTLTGVAVPELRDQNGNLLPVNRRDAFSGTRMAVEPIPG